MGRPTGTLAWLLGAWLCAALGGLGCGNGEGGSAERAPGTTAGSVRPPTGGTSPPAGKVDAGSDAGDTDTPGADAGAEPPGMAGDDGVLATECRTIDAADFRGEDTPVGGLYNGVSQPADFSVTRVQSTWAPDCLNPTYRITLSDGRCPDGDGHELVFLIEADAVDSGLVLFGQNEILEEPGTRGIRVRYRRPADLDPAGEWGTCELASGKLDLIGDVSLEKDAELQGSFQLELTACDVGTDGIQRVVGTFNTPVRRSRDQACPPDAP